jgi:hypothetical protein
MNGYKPSEESKDADSSIRDVIGDEVLPNTYRILFNQYKDDPLKAFDRLVWRMEIDIENIEDLMSHLENRKEQTF